MAERLPGDTSPAFASRLREALREARILLDAATYVPWRVFELSAGPLDRRTSPTLIFESEGAMHRVRDYPANWRDLTDEELLALRRRS